MANDPRSYPPENVILADDTHLVLRAIRLDDAPRLQALAARLSPQSMYLRAMMPLTSLSDRNADRLANVDYDQRMALVAVRATAEGDEIVGVARYAGERSVQVGEAEIAIVVEDRFQGLGLGTLLIKRLAAYARQHGFRTFLASVLAANAPVLHMIQNTGMPTETTGTSPGERQVRISLGPEG